MAGEAEALGTVVTSTVGVMASAKVLIDKFAAFTLANANNPQKMRDFATELKTASDDLAAGVAANPDPAAPAEVAISEAVEAAK